MASFCTSGAGARALGGLVISAIKPLIGSLLTALRLLATPVQVFFLGGGLLRDSIKTCCPLVLTIWTSLQICWKVIGLCSATAAPASSIAGPLLSLDDVAEALRCCWCERWDPRDPLDPSEL